MSTDVSTLLLEEFFKHGDERFFNELVSLTATGKLRSFATKWLAEERPFAREMLFRCIDDGCERSHYRPPVKALFRHFEAKADDGVMGHILVAFDRSIRRQIVTSRQWDPVLRGYADAKVLARDRRVPARDWQKAMLQTLALNDAADIQRPEQFLDAWGLVHALYWGHRFSAVEGRRAAQRGRDARAARAGADLSGGVEELPRRARGVAPPVAQPDGLKLGLKWLRREYPASELLKLSIAALRSLRKTGLAAQNREGMPHFESWLRGKLGCLSLVEPEKGFAMMRELDTLTAAAKVAEGR